MVKINPLTLWHRLVAASGKLQAIIWNWLVTGFYNQVPTTEGELDAELEREIQHGLLFVGMRFKGFNRSVGYFVRLGLSLTLILFPTTFIVFIIQGVAPDAIATFTIFLYGIFIVTSMAVVVLADIVLLLYFLAMLWFSIRQIRPKFAKIEKDRLEWYECRSDGDIISIYTSNFTSFVRGSLNVFLSIIVLVYWGVSSQLLSFTRKFAADMPTRNIPQSSLVSVFSDMIAGINALIPINISFFFTPGGFRSLAVLISVLLLFSAFLNIKKILQYAERSQFEWAVSEAFSAEDEINRCYKVVKISLHHLIHGELEGEFREIRGEILEAGLLLVAATLLSAIYTYLFLNA